MILTPPVTVEFACEMPQSMSLQWVSTSIFLSVTDGLVQGFVDLMPASKSNSTKSTIKMAAFEHEQNKVEGFFLKDFT